MHDVEIEVMVFLRADVKWIDPAEVLEGGKRLPAFLSCAEHKFQHELVRLFQEEVVDAVVLSDAFESEKMLRE